MIKEITIEPSLLCLDEVCRYIGLGRNGTRELMDKIGATRRLGKRILFDKVVIDEFLDNKEK